MISFLAIGTDVLSSVFALTLTVMPDLHLDCFSTIDLFELTSTGPSTCYLDPIIFAIVIPAVIIILIINIQCNKLFGCNYMNAVYAAVSDLLQL